MYIEIRQIGVDVLPRYAEIPESFRVESILLVKPVGRGLLGFRFTEQKVQPYMKWDESYDDDSGPANWPKQFDVAEWGIFIAFKDSRPVGGVAVGADAPVGLTTPYEDKEAAVLWDIRVQPDERRQGVATKLFKQAADWARKKGYTRLKLETTSTNVPMCHFCAKQGCELAAVHRYGYETAPKAKGESMLIWYYNLYPK